MNIFIYCRRADSTYLVGCVKGRSVTALGEEIAFCNLDDIPAGGGCRPVLEEETDGNSKTLSGHTGLVNRLDFSPQKKLAGFYPLLPAKTRR